MTDATSRVLGTAKTQETIEKMLPQPKGKYIFGIVSGIFIFLGTGGLGTVCLLKSYKVITLTNTGKFFNSLIQKLGGEKAPFWGLWGMTSGGIMLGLSISGYSFYKMRQNQEIASNTSFSTINLDDAVDESTLKGIFKNELLQCFDESTQAQIQQRMKIQRTFVCLQIEREIRDENGHLSDKEVIFVIKLGDSSLRCTDWILESTGLDCIQQTIEQIRELNVSVKRSTMQMSSRAITTRASDKVSSEHQEQDEIGNENLHLQEIENPGEVARSAGFIPLELRCNPKETEKIKTRFEKDTSICIRLIRDEKEVTIVLKLSDSSLWCSEWFELQTDFGINAKDELLIGRMEKELKLRRLNVEYLVDYPDNEQEI